MSTSLRDKQHPLIRQLVASKTQPDTSAPEIATILA
jgi:hypothetical protein